MRLATILLAALLLQEPPSVALASVEEKEQALELTFSGQKLQGARMKVKAERRCTFMSWAPWLEKDGDGRPVELVNTSVRERRLTVLSEKVQPEREDGFVLTWKPGLAAGYRLHVSCDRPGNPAEHRVLAFAPGELATALVDEAREALKFSAEFFKALQAAIPASETEFDVEDRMKDRVAEAGRRSRKRHHSGSYSLLEKLSPFLRVAPDPEKKDSADHKVFPNRVDIKSAAMETSIIRESMYLAIQALEDALEEAALLSSLPESTYVGVRAAGVQRVGTGLPGAVRELRKLEPASRLVRLWRDTEYLDLMDRSCELILHMMEKRKPDHAGVAKLLERLTAAAKRIGHPRDSIKQ